MEVWQISITINEKILLFLLDFNKYRDSVEVPFAVSQKGISEGVEIRITHIPRAVQKLLNDEFITEFKTHFRGHLRKRKAYFLTEKGTAKAQAIKESVGGQIVTYKTNDGRTLEKTLQDMHSDYGMLMGFFEFYILYSKHSVLEESILDGYKSTRKEHLQTALGEFKDFRDNVPDHSDILGRSGDLETIENWFASPELRVLCLTGVKGIGKSALAAETVKYYQRENYVFWLTFQSGSSWDSLVHALAEFASNNNYFKLDKYVKRTANIIPSKTCELLAEDLSDLKLLVVLDDVHKIKDGLKDFGMWLIPFMQHLPQWNIIITSRDPIPIELRSKNDLEGKYIELKLSGLDIATSRQLFKTELTPQEFESIYNYTEGNPLYLKAIRDLEADGKLDLKQFRPEELSLLKFLKVHEELD